MWESREQFEQYAREQFSLQRHIIRLLERLLEQVNFLERKVDKVATNVLVSQQSLQDLVTAEQSLDAQVLAVLAYLQTITSNPPDDTAQLQSVTADVNARVTALIDGLKAAQAGNPPPAATVTLTADPASITAGGSSTLTVTATNATSVIITGSDGSSFTLPAAGGTQAVSPTATTTYTATADTATATAVVTVA